FILTFVQFDIIWRYFAWANQTLAVVVLWTITVYLAQEKKAYGITLIPALIMTSVITAYLCISPEVFALSKPLTYSISIGISGICGFAFYMYLKKHCTRSTRNMKRSIEN